MVETEMRVDGISFVLAFDENIEALREAIEVAASTTGRFVDVRSVGEGRVGILIGPRSRVMLFRRSATVNSADLVIPLVDEPDWTLTL